MAATRVLRAALDAARRRWRPLGLLLLIPTGFVAACLWLTEPLEPLPAEPAAPASPVARSVDESAPVAYGRPVPAWPSGRLEGQPAKVLLLDALRHAADRLDKVDAYTATFRRQERIKGALGPLQTLALKVRHRPFSVYLKFLNPGPGREVVYAEGRHDNKMIAHGGGLARLLVPRLAVPPEHPLALKDSRHAVTEAGIANLTRKLIGYREMDLDDHEAVTILDETTDANGRRRLRSLHTHPNRHANRPFAKVIVLYEPETFFPVEIHSYDWPEPGHAGDLLLAEHYAYDDLILDAPLTAIDFDPANPGYSFHRY